MELPIEKNLFSIIVLLHDHETALFMYCDGEFNDGV